jgi:Bacterial PH domain
MKQVFLIVPASAAALALPGVVLLLLLAGIVFFGYLAYSTQYVRFEVSPAGVKISGDLYGRSIPARDLVTGEAREVDLDAAKPLQLVARTNGSGLPGYKSGWFALRNGGKALVFVTDPKRVVYVPTRDGYSLLLSVADPQRFVEALKQAIPAG